MATTKSAKVLRNHRFAFSAPHFINLRQSHAAPYFFSCASIVSRPDWLIVLSPAQAFPALAEHEQLFQTANGQQITPSDLLDTLNQADVSAWGEVHDNPRHHALRADLLRAMSLRGVTIVAEHMDAGKRIDMRQSLPVALARAGFDATGWQWPLHQVLFEAVQQTGLALYGGNIPAAQTKEVFKSQGASVSANCNTCCAKQGWTMPV
jgi:uncharacterized iron-regulated protein